MKIYEKPVAEVIELIAEEVMGSGTVSSALPCYDKHSRVCIGIV